MFCVRKWLFQPVFVFILFGFVISQKDLELWEASKDGNLDAVFKGLAVGENPNWSNPDHESGWTALHVSSVSNHPAIVSALLYAGAKTNLTDSNHGSTALHLAAIMNNSAVIRALLVAGAKKDVCRWDGITPIFAASMEGSIDAVNELIAHSADFNLPNCAGWFGEMTPLMIAASEGHLYIVKKLLSVHANVRHSLPMGYTALHGAAGAGRQDIVLLLLQHGADARKLSESKSPSDIARKKGFDRLASFLDNYAVSNNPTKHDKPIMDVLYQLAGGVAMLITVAMYF